MSNEEMKPCANDARNSKNKMHIGIDRGDGRDFTSVALRIGRQCHIVPDPFARQLMPYLESQHCQDKSAQDEKLAVVEEALEKADRFYTEELDSIGGCDHSVGICCCRAYDEQEDIKQALATIKSMRK